jgi:uncharacterized membrane protein
MNERSEPYLTSGLWLSLLASFSIAGYFIAANAAPYLQNFTAAVYGPYWPVRTWMLLHVGAGVAALIIGAGQLCLGFMRRTSRWHRWCGRAYVCAVLLSCVAAFFVLANGSAVGPGFGALVALLSIYALAFTSMGLFAARRRWRQMHRDWMIRSYMTVMVFALFRLAVKLPVLQDLGFSERFTALIAITMVATLVCTELLLQLAKIVVATPRDRDSSARSKVRTKHADRYVATGSRAALQAARSR